MTIYSLECKLTSAARDTRFFDLVWALVSLRREIAHNARYNSPVVRAIRALIFRVKPFGMIYGFTDCDGMRYGGADVYWTRAAAEASADATYDGAEGPGGCDVVTGAEAREFIAGYEPDTRDRYAEAMNY